MATTSGPRLLASRASVTVPPGNPEELEHDSEAISPVDGIHQEDSAHDLERRSGSPVSQEGIEEEKEEGSDAGSIPGSSGSCMSDRGLRHVDSAVGFETDLEIDDEKEEYDLSGKKVYLETCKELGVVPASYFVRHMGQAELIMKHHGLGPLGAKAISIPLVANTIVNELDIEDNWIQTSGAIYIADMLKENCYISHLNLANNNTGSDAAKALCEMMIINTTLTHVNLSGNGFQPKDAKYFAQVILENNRITRLDLSHNGLGEDVGDAIGHAVGENETLERIDLSWNNFRRDSGNKLLDGIQVNSRLKCANLAWNGFGLDCAPALANCLRYNCILTELDVSNNRITMDAALTIGRGLEANETLQILRIGRNPIGPGGALTLLASINNERSLLTMLDLTEVWVEKEFEDLFHDIRESRQDLERKHAGVLGLFATKKKKTDADETDLDRFLNNDPMAIIRKHTEDNNIRLLELFRAFDKNGDYKITPTEFKNGIKSAGIDLTPSQVDDLMNRLDSSKDGDGKVDYRI